MDQYIPVLIAVIVAGMVALGMTFASTILGVKKLSQVKGDPFEGGNPPTGSAWGRFSVKFYLAAILFIVFDVEVVFLYPWAIVFRQLGMFGFAAMAVFFLVLTIGLIYEIRKGGLEST